MMSAIDEQPFDANNNDDGDDDDDTGDNNEDRCEFGLFC